MLSGDNMGSEMEQLESISGDFTSAWQIFCIINDFSLDAQVLWYLLTWCLFIAFHEEPGLALRLDLI